MTEIKFTPNIQYLISQNMFEDHHLASKQYWYLNTQIIFHKHTLFSFQELTKKPDGCDISIGHNH